MEGSRCGAAPCPFQRASCNPEAPKQAAAPHQVIIVVELLEQFLKGLVLQAGLLPDAAHLGGSHSSSGASKRLKIEHNAVGAPLLTRLGNRTSHQEQEQEASCSGPEQGSVWPHPAAMCTIKDSGSVQASGTNGYAAKGKAGCVLELVVALL